MDGAPQQGSGLPPVHRRIRPAGWIVIALLVGGAAWGAWKLARPLLDRPALPPAPEREAADAGVPAAEAPDAGTAGPERVEGLVLDRELFPAAGPQLPVVRGALPKVVLPPLSGLAIPDDVPRAPSELEAIRMVARGEADATVASVAAFAAAPEVIAHGVKAAWLVGESPEDAGLFPSCHAEALRRSKLTAVRGSLGHFHLLAALAGQPLPEVALFDRDVDVERAIHEGLATGGARRLPREGAKGACTVLPASSFSLVVVRRTDRELPEAQLASLAALGRMRAPAPEEVAAFFDPKRRAPGGFADVFESAGDVWKAIGLVDRPARARDAVDPGFLDAATPAGEPDAPPPASSPGAREWGFPSSFDLR